MSKSRLLVLSIDRGRAPRARMRLLRQGSTEKQGTTEKTAPHLLGVEPLSLEAGAGRRNWP